MTVISPARLHLGFIDMHGGLGRTYGSLGVCLEDIATRLTAIPSNDVIIQGPSGHRASLYAGRILEHLSIPKGIAITVHEAIPEHAGLGSGTQLSLAVGTAIATLYQREISVREIANLMGRGARSGIGVGAFSLGGFLVDGGRGDHTGVPPIISHLRFPEAWRLVLVFDQERQGVHGDHEREAFQHLPPIGERITEYLCRLTLMQVLPALVEADCRRFGAAITAIQERVGDHFAAVQGGRFCSPHVREILPWMQAHGAAGIGQSSWGPTGFALFANETQAYQALKTARDKWHAERGLAFKLCRARNQKAEVRLEPMPAAGNIKLKHL